MNKQIVTIIINWKLKEDTVRSIRYLQQSDYPTDIIVVDNGSNDDSTKYIKQHCPNITLLALPDNIGFGSACNRAITQSLRNTLYHYLFLLNNDAVIHPHALSELIDAATAHPEAGILGAKVYYSDKPDTIWYAGARRRQGVLAATDVGRGQVDRGQFNNRREVDYIFGAAMLIKRQVFETIGYFDERFFLYLEDLDFSLRAQRAGFTLLFVPTAHVWHDGSASTAQKAALRRYYMAKSTVHFLRKHTSLGLSVPVFGFWVLVYLRDIALDMARGDWEIVRSYWAGMVSGLNEMRKTR